MAVRERKPATDYVGLSSDTKPRPVADCSTFLELDTAMTYIYDADKNRWRSLTP